MTATRTRKAPAKAPIKRGPTAGYHVKVDTDGLCMAIEITGLSLREVARRAGLSDGAVKNLACGARVTCKPETAATITKALGLKEKTARRVFQLVHTAVEW